MAKIYEYGVSPLLEVDPEDLLEGNFYITEDGYMGVCVIEDDGDELDVSLRILKNSPLVDGEEMSGLNERQLELYWTLLKNQKGRTVNGNTDKD